MNSLDMLIHVVSSPKQYIKCKMIQINHNPLQVALHKEIRHPQAEEKVPRPLLLLAMVLAKLQEVEDVGVPWLLNATVYMHVQ